MAAAGSDIDGCPRFTGGSTVTQPPEVSSSKGELHVALAFRSQTDEYGLIRYCYISENGIESPTLRVRPGDEVVLDLKNDLAPMQSRAMPGHGHTDGICSAGPMTEVSTNMHFHGLAIPPACHQDDVIHTSIQPGEPVFQYRFRIPAEQPPGLYWYHPHPHGHSEDQVLGGASGALIVEGMAAFKPQAAGLPERVLILRDQRIPGPRKKSYDRDDENGKDVSLNFVPVTYPLYMPAVMRVQADEREFWRVLNASADTYFALQLISVENGQRVPRSLQLIATDGTPVADSVSSAPLIEILISPGARAEFIVTTPREGALSQLVSRSYDTGSDGGANPSRVIANIVSGNNTHPVEAVGLPESLARETRHFDGLAGIRPRRVRRLFLSEDREDLRTPGKLARYFITVGGRAPAVFDMNFRRPDIIVRQGTVEDWIIENPAREAHVFHIHQIHFQLVERDGIKVDEQMLRDTIDLPYWDGKAAQYPAVRLRMDFRSPAIMGTFLFHCHILEHEDAGMMGTVEVEKRELFRN